MKKTFLWLTPVAALVLVVAGAALRPPSADSSSPVSNKILAHKLNVELGKEQAKPWEMPVSGGVMTAVLEHTGITAQRAAAWSKNGSSLSASQGSGGISRARTEGCQNKFHGHGMTNIRVNQDCSFRRQAEEAIQLNPLDERNFVAGQNDSRIGFNHCGYDWSFNAGRTWGDQVPPFWQFQLLDGHTSDACSDPTVAFDSRANVYVGGVFFDVAADANAVLVMKSNAPNGGAFYHSPDPAGGFQEFRDLPVGVVANDLVDFNDKELMTADAWVSSPKRDNVYMTWTKFNAAGHSPIYFSQSTNGGATWSPGVEISGSNPAICTVPAVGPCNDDQGSHPVVGRDGTIYVVFGNSNTPLQGINQVLFVKCLAAANCANSANWTAPVKVGDLIGTHPIGNPGNAGGCPVGRRCLPPNGYRVPEFTSMSISVDNDSKLYVAWSDFRNGDDPGSTCGPHILWTAAIPPCDNDVFYAFSTNGGAAWSPTRNITPAARLGANAQWQPWSEVTADGSRLWVAFYDRQYGNCETTGCNDITAAEIRNPTAGNPSVRYTRVTTDSMPNLTPANNPVQAGFLGDYMWVDTDSHEDAHIVWADTRPIRGDAPEEDIYYAKVQSRGGH
jgi:hypothetical protein